MYIYTFIGFKFMHIDLHLNINLILGASEGIRRKIGVEIINIGIVLSRGTNFLKPLSLNEFNLYFNFIFFITIKTNIKFTLCNYDLNGVKDLGHFNPLIDSVLGIKYNDNKNNNNL